MSAYRQEQLAGKDQYEGAYEPVYADSPSSVDDAIRNTHHLQFQSANTHKNDRTSRAVHRRHDTFPQPLGQASGCSVGSSNSLSHSQAKPSSTTNDNASICSRLSKLNLHCISPSQFELQVGTLRGNRTSARSSSYESITSSTWRQQVRHV